MIGLAASILDGVLVGSVYGLAAMGITLIWGVMNVINLTHGAMIVAGMFGLYFLVNAAGLSPYATLPLVLVAGFLCALGFSLFLMALSMSGAAAVTTIRNTSVAFTVVFSLALGERPGRRQWLGVVLVTLGAVGLGWK